MHSYKDNIKNPHTHGDMKTKELKKRKKENI